MVRAFCVISLLFLAANACGSGDGIDSNGQGGAGGGGLLGGGGNGPGVVGCDKDLSGTWDLFASSNGTGVLRGTLVISKDGFSFTSHGAELVYSAKKSATWNYNGGYSSKSTRLISVENTPANVDSGSIPLALGGQWVIASNSETCILNITSGKVTGKCTGRAEDYNVGGDDWPWQLMDSPENRVTYTIERTAKAASQFGDFGGSWSAHSDTGSQQGCTFLLENGTASSICQTNNSFDGNLRLTVGADCVASGVTPGGAEVSARRR